jgi:hypothetical protein
MTDAGAAPCPMARPMRRFTMLTMLHPPRPSRRPTAQERQFLEQLVLLRGIYAERGPKDSDGSISLSSAIAAAELQMHRLRVRDDELRQRFAAG